MKLIPILALIVLIGCSRSLDDNQQIDNSAAIRQPYPELLPIEDTLVRDKPRLNENSENELDARAQRLRKRGVEFRQMATQ